MNIWLIKILNIHICVCESKFMYILTVSAFGDHKVSTCGMRLKSIIKIRDQFKQNSCVFVDKLNNLLSKIVIQPILKKRR